MPEPDTTPWGHGLALDAVSAGYGAFDVVHEVTVHARPGEVTGLIGPNGSGKSTLVRVASRGLAPRSGSVRIGGVDPYGLSTKVAARLVAVVPQDLASAFTFSVLEMVLMGRSPYLSRWGGGRAEDWSKARRAMASANVQHLADRPVEELSGGERRRVVLAQALAQDAPVLLLDEPTTHLDIRHVVDSLALVRSLAREEGRTVLAIFHDLNLASGYCDRLYALSAGRVVAEGTPESVITRSLVAEVFGVEAEVAPSGTTGRPSVVVAPAVAARTPGGPRAHVVGGAGRGAQSMRLLLELGYDVSAGVLHAGDTDETVADRLNVRRVTVPPFSEIDDASATDCGEMMASATVLIVCDAPFGPGNVRNLRLALSALSRGTRTVLVRQVPIEERDFTSGEATRLWRELSERATVVTSTEELRPLLSPVIAPGAPGAGTS